MGDNGLLERDHERARLRAVVAAAHDGTGAAAVIDGPAGIGKTRLLEEAVRAAEESGARVLRARGGEMERDLPYGVVRQLLEREARTTGEQVLRGAARLAAPVLGLGAEPGGDAGSEAEREFALCHGLYWLVCSLSERGSLVLVVDDLQIVDAPSLRFLLYLVRRVQGLPLALVGALRSGAGAADQGALAQLSTDDCVVTIRPRGLSSKGVAALVKAHLGAEPSADFVGACLDVTGGNPFLVEQLLAAAADEGLCPDARAVARVRELVPDAVTRSVLLRLDREPAEVARLAQAVAVLGDDVALPRACKVAGLDGLTGADCADRLADLSLLRNRLPLSYLHALLRTTVLAGMKPSVRAAMHERAAEVLEAEGAPPGAVAAHLAKRAPAGDEHVVSILRAAAAAALERGAADIALRQLRRALIEPPPAQLRGALLAQIGHAATYAGDPAAAVEALDESVALADDPVDRVVRQMYAFRAHFALDARIDGGDILRILDQVEALGEARDPGVQTLFGDVLAAGTALTAMLPELGRRLAPFAEKSGDGTIERFALATLSRTACLSDPPRAADFAVRAVAGGRMLSELGTESVSLGVALFTLIDADRLELAEEHVAAGLDQARRRGSVFGYAAQTCMSALAAYQRGDLVRAEAEATAALETGSLHAALVPLVLACLVRTLLAAGDVEGAGRLVDPVGDGDLPDLTVVNHVLVARAQVRFARGDVAGARAWFGEILERLPRAVRYSRVLPWRQYAVPVLLACGEHEEALAVADDDVAAAREWGTPGAMGAALATRAACLAARSEREGVLREAIELLEQSPARLDLAAAQLSLGETLAELGSPEQARAPLWAGLELAEACGALALAERGRAALKTVGARPARRTLHGADSLTPSERRVADLVAGGLSNRAVAEALFVTAKTVENQLGRVYAKLGISGRGELAGALAQG